MEASESLSCENNNSSLFSALPGSSNMYSNKDSNLISAPVPYFQQIERGHISESRLSDMDSQEAVFARGMQIPPQQVNPWETTELLGGIGYHPVVTEIDRVSTYTKLDDYDTLFEARYGRGALGHVPRKSEEMVITSSMGIIPTTSSASIKVNPLDKVKPTIGREHASQREHVSMTTDPLKCRVVSPSLEIIGEGAAIFTDMTDTMLTALDQQMAMSSDAQKPECIPSSNDMTVG